MADPNENPFDLRPTARLRFCGYAPVGISTLERLVASMDEAYSLLCFYSTRVDLAVKLAREPETLNLTARGLQLRLHDEAHMAREREGARERRGGRSYYREMGRLSGYPLALSAVRLESLGFWEFAGSLNPLGQVRGYLNERHERRKDDEFRNEPEARRLMAEARLAEAEARRAELEVLRTQYEIAAQIVGADDARKLAASALENLGAVVAASNGDRDPRPALMPGVPPED